MLKNPKRSFFSADKNQVLTLTFRPQTCVRAFAMMRTITLFEWLSCLVDLIHFPQSEAGIQLRGTIGRVIDDRLTVFIVLSIRRHRHTKQRQN